MDATLGAVLTNSMTTWKGDIFTQYGSVLVIALPVAIGMALAFATIKWFRGIAHF